MNLNLVLTGTALVSVFSIGCTHLPIAKDGAWRGSLPEAVTVKEAARVDRPWYGKAAAPFAITLIAGSRTGLEYNEGRDLRPAEYIKGIPFVGLITLPYFCWESLSKKSMQRVANQGMDKRRQRKYEAIIKRLEQEGRMNEADFLKVHSPFDPANHPPNPSARMPKQNLNGVWGIAKTLWVELAIGHRESLERNESRGVRKLEYWHPLLLTRIWEAFEAGAGRNMEDIAEKEHLDVRWLPELKAQTVTDQGK